MRIRLVYLSLFVLVLVGLHSTVGIKLRRDFGLTQITFDADEEPLVEVKNGSTQLIKIPLKRV